MNDISTILNRYNIFTNNCLGGYIYSEHSNIGYNNPLIWSTIENDDIVKLINNFSYSLFDNPKLITCSDEYLNTKDIYVNINKENVRGICLDYDIKIWYIHYLFDTLYDIPTKSGNNILYNNIDEYVFTKFVSRKNKLNKELKPLFIIDTHNMFDTSFINNLNTNHIVIVISDNTTYINNNVPNLINFNSVVSKRDILADKVCNYIKFLINNEQ